MAKLAKKEYYVVAYRTGGWMNAIWHETQVQDGKEKAAEMQEKINRQGYKTRIFSLSELRSIGLPTGFCVHADSLTGRMEEKRCNCL